ncbi:hypothetical protein NHF46_19355 [Arthrobacter alpinus]|nr:hypothetical protein [Arthrobacter alpinus]
MNRDEFDARYPEMFQPGGEEHDFQVYIPEPAPQNPDHASFRAPQAPRQDRVTAVRATAVEARSGSGDNYLNPPRNRLTAPSPKPTTFTRTNSAPMNRNMNTVSARSTIISPHPSPGV